jgi:iron-sulfur cluster repair protein YtfE (RIC family)
MSMYDRDHEWLSSQSSELAGYVMELGRNDVAVKLPRIGDLFSVVLLEQGDANANLFEAARLAGELKRLLRGHYAGVGGELLARASGDVAEAGAGTFSRPEVVSEHRALAAVLDRMREASFGYTLTPGMEEGADDVARWSDLYDTLRDLDLDVRRHIYIEEELLMPLLKRQAV